MMMSFSLSQETTTENIDEHGGAKQHKPADEHGGAKLKPSKSREDEAAERATPSNDASLRCPTATRCSAMRGCCLHY
jgi:hypothetical protein